MHTIFKLKSTKDSNSNVRYSNKLLSQLPNSLLTKFIGFSVILTATLICLRPENSFAADSVESMSNDVTKLATGSVKQAVGAVAIVGGMGAAIFMGNLKLAASIVTAVIMVTIAFALNKNGIALLG